MGALAGLFRRFAQWRVGRLPAGLLALLPVAVLLDLFDVLDEFALGPVGMAVSFVAEAAFLLGVTGRPTYSLGFAGVDLIPGLDLIPFATLAVLAEIGRAWREDPGVVRTPDGPVIDV